MPLVGQQDAVVFLSVYVVLLYAVPTGLRFTALGSVGSPALLWGLIGLLLWGADRIHRRKPLVWQLGLVPSAMIAFALTVGMSFITSMLRGSPPVEGDTADTGLIKVAAWAGVLLVAHDGIRSWMGMRAVLRRIVLAATLLALLGQAQFWTGEPLIDWVSIPGMTLFDTVGLEQRGAFTRISGTAVHPLEFGVIMCMALPCALVLALHDRDRSWVTRWLPVVVIAVTIGMSTSRSALIGLGTAIAIMVIGWPRRLRVLASAGMLGLAVAVYLVVPGMAGLVLGLFGGLDQDSSIASRTGAYEMALSIVSTAPLLGRGFSTFVAHYLILDNQHLLLLVEIGVIGLVAFLALGCTALMSGLLGRRDASTPFRRDMGQAFVAAVATGYLLLTFFDGLSFPQSAGTLFLFIGLAGAYRRLALAPDP